VFLSSINEPLKSIFPPTNSMLWKFFLLQSNQSQKRWKSGPRCYPPHSSTVRMRSVQKSSRAKFVRAAVAAFHLPVGLYIEIVGYTRVGERR
jgi:hypothetical protein